MWFFNCLVPVLSHLIKVQEPQCVLFIFMRWHNSDLFRIATSQSYLERVYVALGNFCNCFCLPHLFNFNCNFSSRSCHFSNEYPGLRFYFVCVLEIGGSFTICKQTKHLDTVHWLGAC